MSKLDVTKKHYSKLKAMSKITNIPGHLQKPVLDSVKLK